MYTVVLNLDLHIAMDDFHSYCFTSIKSEKCKDQKILIAIYTTSSTKKIHTSIYLTSN